MKIHEIFRMKLGKLWFLCCISLVYACEEKEERFDKFQPLDDYSIYMQNEEQRILFNTAVTACETSLNFGKSVAVFGGSLSSLPESRIAKGLWKKYLHMDIKTYGKPGYGFSSAQGSIQNQVNAAGKYDIYILWASTNDYTTQRPLGEATDYTEYDEFNPKKLKTQCGGINSCIKRLREINPQASIYLFTSLKFFGTNGIQDYGYEIDPVSNNGSGYSFYDYVRKQKECAWIQNISCFDQWEAQEGRITRENYSDYYLEDGFHMSETGYFDIGIRQLLFLAQAK